MLSIESPHGGSNPSTTAHILFMKILVTGGNGFIGSNLIKSLLQQKHKVVSLDDLSIGLKEYEVEGCHYHYGDIELIHLMDKDFDLIYHLAALSRIQPSFKNPTDVISMISRHENFDSILFCNLLITAKPPLSKTSIIIFFCVRTDE